MSEKKKFTAAPLSEQQRKSVEEAFRTLQDDLCAQFTQIGNGQQYYQDEWTYARGSGGGRSRVYAARDDWSRGETTASSRSESNNGPGSCARRDQLLPFWEKGGCNWSGIYGSNLPAAALQKWDVEVEAGRAFQATGVSLVLHPANPWVPSIHCNVRFFYSEGVWWFGGGIDLTPYYPMVSQIQAFHEAIAQLYEQHGMNYTVDKEHCDRYFYLPHRNETRGVGGVFFDALPHEQHTFDEQFAFVLALGRLVPQLIGAFRNNAKRQFTKQMRDFQLYRRGRYVEFNLLFDRGTRFGIVSKGRTESILMSLPATVHFDYDWSPDTGTMEDFLYRHFLHPQDWNCVTVEQLQSIREEMVEPEEYQLLPETKEFHSMHRDYENSNKGISLLRVSSTIGVVALAVMAGFYVGKKQSE